MVKDWVGMLLFLLCGLWGRLAFGQTFLFVKILNFSKIFKDLKFSKKEVRQASLYKSVHITCNHSGETEEVNDPFKPNGWPHCIRIGADL